MIPLTFKAIRSRLADMTMTETRSIDVEELDKLFTGGLVCNSQAPHDCLINAEYKVSAPCAPDHNDVYWCKGRHILHLMMTNSSQQLCIYCKQLMTPTHWNVIPI